ncbi:class IV lanthionine synthetase LanL [Dactylosporangium sp. NPDC049140]|uniref:class IV lanthionine synthetase LanL n=1 Tax=Dactylosporangium sp. NPDC049140 TaxID=3155647 RepID=UPI0034079415
MASDAWLLEGIVRGVLDRADAAAWTVEPGDFWCVVRPAAQPAREEGWKLHVSSTVLAGPVVLARVAGVLVGEGCAFKFARDLDRLGQLLSNQSERGSGGKFVTVYPRDDEQFRRLALELDRVTDGLPGPAILSDRAVRPGSVVHYRYGGFRARPVLSNDGDFRFVVTGPDGRKVPDERRAWFSPPPGAVPPLPAAETPPSQPGRPGPVLIGDRFVVRGAIRHSYKGGIYRGTDRRTGATVVLKRARPHAMSGWTGEDARALLRHEADMLDVLAPLQVAPAKVALVTHQEHLFLAEEWIDGTTLRKWVNERALGEWGGRGAPLAEAVELGIRLVDLLAAVHTHGIVLRDMTPSNIMVTPDGRLRLVDLEHAVRAGDLAARVFTPGYAAPEQVTARRFGAVPGHRSDLFSLGATIFWLAGGVHPLLPPDEPAERSYHQRLTDLVERAGAHMPTVRRFAPLILGLTEDDPERRWSLADARTFLGTDKKDGVRAPASKIDIDRLIGDGLSHVHGTATPGAERLWRTAHTESASDPLAVQYGAAGVLAVLTQAARTFKDAHRDGLAVAAEWVGERLFTVDRVLPGLYFGRSGTAWALHDAAVLLRDDILAARALDLAKQAPLHWPNADICHGVAGAGMAQLYLWHATGDAELLHRAAEAADNVLDAARERDGQVVWPIPADFDSSLAGITHYGFAHGVAGIGAFLLYAGLATGRKEYLDTARRAGETLARAAIRSGAGAWWSTGEDGAPDVPRQHWCSGSSGVGTFLIRLWAATGERQFRDLAEAAAAAVHRDSWYSSLATCHGLPGDGQFLLDLADFTGEQRFRDQAADLAGLMAVRNTIRDGLMLLPDDTWTDTTVGYATGLSGGLAFLLRLRHGGARWGMPDRILHDAGGR